MHELGLIEEIVRIGETELAASGVSGPVRTLVLRVGKLSGASPEALRGAFEIVAPATRFAGATLEIEEPPATCRCLACGAEHEVDGYTFQCPTCGDGRITIEGGRELQLMSLDVDDGEEPS
ncbi:hydrogenase maturation nickel metallochaperone HypA [bacterium]|nr:hydrogenase maturation nickel metallochaperone HypA [bacterium]